MQWKPVQQLRHTQNTNKNNLALCCEFVPSVIFCPRRVEENGRLCTLTNSPAVVNRYKHIPCLLFKLSTYITSVLLLVALSMSASKQAVSIPDFKWCAKRCPFNTTAIIVHYLPRGNLDTVLTTARYFYCIVLTTVDYY